MTSRHLHEDNFVNVVEFVVRGIEIGIEAQEMTGKSRKS